MCTGTQDPGRRRFAASHVCSTVCLHWRTQGKLHSMLLRKHLFKLGDKKIIIIVLQVSIARDTYSRLA